MIKTLIYLGKSIIPVSKSLDVWYTETLCHSHAVNMHLYIIKIQHKLQNIIQPV